MDANVVVVIRYEARIQKLKDQTGSEHANQLAALQETVRKLSAELESLRNRYEDAVREHEEKEQAMRNAHAQAMNQAAVDAQKAADTAEQQHLGAMNDLQQRMEEDHTLQLGQLHADFERRVKNSNAEHDKKVAELNEQHSAALAAMKAEIDSIRRDSKAAFSKELQDALAAAQQKHSNELESKVFLFRRRSALTNVRW